MAEITRKRNGELIRGVFKILELHPDGLQAKDILEKLETVVPPTQFENSTYPNRPETRRYGKIVRFATIGPVKAGWMTKSKGRWSLTEEGLKAYQQFTDPATFIREAGKLYRKWKKEQDDQGEDDESGETPSAATTLEEAIETAWTEIEEYVAAMNPYDFQ